MFPNTPKKYEDFFRAIAGAHPNIMATEENYRFTTIVQSAMPFAQWDLSEYQKTKSSLSKTLDDEGNHKLIFVLVMMDTDRENEKKEINGSFILLRRVTQLQDWKARLAAQDMAYTTGNEILAWVQKYFEKNSRKGNLLKNRINDEAVGPVQPNNHFGWIFNFSYQASINPCVTEAVWGDFLPTEDVEEL